MSQPAVAGHRQRHGHLAAAPRPSLTSPPGLCRPSVWLTARQALMLWRWSLHFPLHACCLSQLRALLDRETLGGVGRKSRRLLTVNTGAALNGNSASRTRDCHAHTQRPCQQLAGRAHTHARTRRRDVPCRSRYCWLQRCTQHLPIIAAMHKPMRAPSRPARAVVISLTLACRAASDQQAQLHICGEICVR